LIPVDVRSLASQLRALDLFLESILDLLSGLLQVALHLVGLSFNFELAIANDLSCGLFELALGDLGGVARLVFFSHDSTPLLAKQSDRNLLRP